GKAVRRIVNDLLDRQIRNLLHQLDRVDRRRGHDRRGRRPPLGIDRHGRQQAENGQRQSWGGDDDLAHEGTLLRGGRRSAGTMAPTLSGRSGGKLEDALEVALRISGDFERPTQEGSISSWAP